MMSKVLFDKLKEMGIEISEVRNRYGLEYEVKGINATISHILKRDRGFLDYFTGVSEDSCTLLYVYIRNTNKDRAAEYLMQAAEMCGISYTHNEGYGIIMEYTVIEVYLNDISPIKKIVDIYPEAVRIIDDCYNQVYKEKKDKRDRLDKAIKACLERQ